MQKVSHGVFWWECGTWLKPYHVSPPPPGLCMMIDNSCQLWSFFLIHITLTQGLLVTWLATHPGPKELSIKGGASLAILYLFVKLFFIITWKIIR